jgi:acetyltransferase-like isoleucine patch superfamily enzyme
MGSAYIAGRVRINNYASIGANATIFPDITIGEGAIVGAGSVVTKNVNPYEIVVGNPAKFLKFNNKKYNLKII